VNNPTAPASVVFAARTAFHYLAEVDPPRSTAADAIIGFGVFDLTLPRFCGQLYEQGRARWIIFTGGLGAGTGNLGGPEAAVWRDELLRAYPGFPSDQLVIEDRSTNTTENIQNTADVLAREHPELAFGRGVRSAIIVASPSRLRRVKLALQKLQPELSLTRALPAADFDREHALYASQGIDYLAHITGELDRIVAYPERGWIVYEPLPAPIAEAHDVLRKHVG
jgi:uncharacterized SAM-binding protein YcdF (DUF218 family)